MKSNFSSTLKLDNNEETLFDTLNEASKEIKTLLNKIN